MIKGFDLRAAAGSATPRRTLLMLLCLGLTASASPATAREPWSLDELLGLPERLHVSVDHRLRYEYLDDQFRAGRGGDDELLPLRTRVNVAFDLLDWLEAGAEFQDSRAYLDDVQTPVSTGIINSAELLRAYLEVSATGPFGGSHSLQAGRLTLDVGSRRLVARNRYRNTSNAFTGIDWQWTSEGQNHQLRFFYVLPVRRLPSDAPALRRNEVQFDKETFESEFFGVFYGAKLPYATSLEVYAFGLFQDVSRARRTPRRRLGTAGFRVSRKPKPGQFHFELEAALQAGEVGTFLGNRNLDHFAHFEHLTLGYGFDAPWKPQLSFLYDYASGDDNAFDGKSGRFNTLFGARRFDFGPTSIYGPFARANINTPGLRLNVQPHVQWSAFVAYRAFWLASKRDAWTTARTIDFGGRSGRFIGSQIELIIRYELLPQNVRLEFGYAHLFAGDFIDEAPGSRRQGDSNYVYTQLSLSL